MQPRNLALALVLLVFEEDGDVAEPHAASSKVAMAAAAARPDFLISYLLDDDSSVLPQRPPTCRS
jgi:hypothetical protein